MGTDNLFHRRKAKQSRELARKTAVRSPYEKVLLVCEGEKTEPNYFSELKDHLTLNSANIKISGDCGSSPISVVKYAKLLYQKERTSGDPFDKVYCIFDKDAHASYREALNEIKKAKPKGIFSEITSVPCFEYWLLLHFTYTTSPFHGTGSKSACDKVNYELKKYLPDYKKGDKFIFDKLLNQIEQAKVFANRSLKEADKNHTDNPSTHIHELIVYLENIKINKH